MVELTEKEKNYIDPGVVVQNMEDDPLYPVQNERDLDSGEGYALEPEWLKNTNKGSEEYLRNMLILQEISIPV